jgi:phage I-like protein
MAHRRQPMKGKTTALLALDVGEIANGEVPTEFRIFRFGVNHSEKGDFVFDATSAESVMAEYRAHAKPMLLDFNHGTTLFAPTPEQGIAAGEFVPEVRSDGLWATNIRWTERARQLLAAKEYRCFSPFFETEPSTGRITRLINVALTNLPALDNVEPLVAASAAGGTMEEEMRKRIAELERQLAARDAEVVLLRASATTMVALSATVGLSSSTPVDQVQVAVAGLVSLRSSLYEATGKKSDAEAIGALQALRASHDQLVRLKAEVDAERTTRLTGEFTSALEMATNPDPKVHKNSAKIPPAQRSYWEGICREAGPEKATVQLGAFLDTAVKLTAAPGTPPASSGAELTPQEKDVARRLQISETEWKAGAQRPGGGAT